MPYDLVVVGAGPVGASLARAARGLRVGVVSHARRQAAAAPAGVFDTRVYALSPGNVAFLRELGVWERMPPERLAPVHRMRIHGDDGESRLEFDAYRAGVPALAWIVEDAVLQDALWEGMDACDVLAPARIERLALDADLARLSLADGRTLEARLVAGADGADSFVRNAAGIAAKRSDYGQCAVVANFHCARPHGNTAWQWFAGNHVLALLPLPEHQVSMVWSLGAAEAQRIAALPPDELGREVERAAGEPLGLRAASEARSLKLQRLRASRMVAPRVALAGDAAHVIHPLAGQGLNLGLQDARVLAEVLRAREPVRDAGDLRLLRRYERARAEPVLTMDAAVDGLFALFGSPHPLAGRLRNAGLNLTDRLPVLKNILARHAMR